MEYDSSSWKETGYIAINKKRACQRKRKFWKVVDFLKGLAFAGMFYLTVCAVITGLYY